MVLCAHVVSNFTLFWNYLFQVRFKKGLRDLVHVGMILVIDLPLGFCFIILVLCKGIFIGRTWVITRDGSMT